jgi:TolB-like protein
VRILAALVLALGLPWQARAAPPTIAIADLQNRTGDPAWEGAGAGVAEILLSRFSRVEALQVVERARLADVLGEIALGQGGLVDPATAAEAGRLLGADYLVFGTIFSVDLPSVVVTLKVVESETGRIVTADDVSGTVGERGEEFFVLVDEIAFRLLDALQLQLASRDRIALGQVDVRALGTVEVFGEALAALDRGAPDEAERLLSRALALEPGFLLADEALARLASEVDRRQTAHAHDAIRGVHGSWDRIEAAVADATVDPQPTARDLARLAVRARLHLVRGEFARYFAVEEQRIALTEAGWEELARGVAPHVTFDPTGDFGAEERALVALGGSPNQHSWTFQRLEVMPYRVRPQMAEVLLKLGRRDEAIALVVLNYQRPGPLVRATDHPVHPLSFARKFDVWDVAVVLSEQALRQAELGGRGAETRQALQALDEALGEAQEARDRRTLYEAVQVRLAAEPASLDVLTQERIAQRAGRDDPSLALSGYTAFLRRFEAGYYESVRAEGEFRTLAESWRDVIERLWRDPWYPEQQLAALLAYQAQVPPRDEAQTEAYRRALETAIAEAYHP